MAWLLNPEDFLTIDEIFELSEAAWGGQEGLNAAPRCLANNFQLRPNARRALQIKEHRQEDKEERERERIKEAQRKADFEEMIVSQRAEEKEWFDRETRRNKEAYERAKRDEAGREQRIAEWKTWRDSIGLPTSPQDLIRADVILNIPPPVPTPTDFFPTTDDYLKRWR